MDLNLVYTVSLFFWRGEFCHEESHSNGVAVGSNQSASNRDGIISMITTVVSHGDHANNLPVNACLLSCNLHVRFFFEMKKKQTNAIRWRHTCQFFLEGKRQGGGNFYRNFVFYVQKTAFQGTSSIVMDVVLFLNVVRFCNTK